MHWYSLCFRSAVTQIVRQIFGFGNDMLYCAASTIVTLLFGCKLGNRCEFQFQQCDLHVWISLAKMIFARIWAGWTLHYLYSFSRTISCITCLFWQPPRFSDHPVSEWKRASVSWLSSNILRPMPSAHKALTNRLCMQRISPPGPTEIKHCKH